MSRKTEDRLRTRSSVPAYLVRLTPRLSVPRRPLCVPPFEQTVTSLADQVADSSTPWKSSQLLGVASGNG